MPALLWYVTVSLASCVLTSSLESHGIALQNKHVIAICNTSAFWAYLMNIRLRNAKIQVLKLSSVLLTCVGMLL